ncbi:MAG: nuclear transport factor 2 family protein [Beijerinckiaceae bacterium]
MNEEDAVLAVNAAYYRAFANADAPSLERLWAFDGVTCVHPGWRPLVGREDVVRSYRDILAGAQQVPITHSGERVVISGEFARVICIERVGTVLLAATNCFVRTGQGWLMAHHQASQIADVEEPRASRRQAATRTLN